MPPYSLTSLFRIDRISHMPRYDQSSAECLVFTYKAGMLSPLGHDLKIKITSFVIDLDRREGRIEAWFDAQSLRVECAMLNGTELPGVLSDKDKKEIDDNIVRDVFEGGFYRDIRFTSRSFTGEAGLFRIAGALFLHGSSREVAFTARSEGAYLVAEVKLHQHDFDIRPFSALFGMMRIKPDVLVRVVVPGVS